MTFWDASAVVHLCVEQRRTARARRLFGEDRQVVVWWGTPVEVMSAFARLEREGVMSAEESGNAAARLAVLRTGWFEVAPTDALRDEAERLPRVHALRAGDAFQLSAALAWCKGKPRRRRFVCSDERLSAAATAFAFTVANIT